MRDGLADAVKVDLSFVRQLDDVEGSVPVIASILGLARGLGLRTVAEGVETERQLAALHALGCDAAQGYLVAHPQSPDVIARLLGPDLRWPNPAPPQ